MTDFFVVVESEHVISVLRMLKLDVRTFFERERASPFAKAREQVQHRFPKQEWILAVV